ncbi:MAG TPA: hypothetical protein DCP47_02880 [Phycisphaerales bacterium]|nr:hypothetical protein [Phycisphaerales bacterium]
MVLGAKELVTLASGLMEGKFPTVHRRLKIHRGRAAGVFYPAQPVGKIGLRADIAIGPIIRQARVKRGTEEFAITAIMAELLDTGLKTSDIHIAKNRDRSSGKTILSFYRKDLQYAAKIIAHEIGHLIDWLPDHVTTRGNILGKIATLRGYLKHIIAALPDHPEDTLEDSIRRRLKRQANTSARKQNPKASSEDLKKTASEIYKQLLEKELANRNLISKQQITEELKNLTLWWNPFNPQQNDNYAKYRFKPSELYAEAMSVLLTNPAALRLKAPRFYDAFFAYLDEKPAVKELYEKINDELRTGSFEDNNVARVLESFRTADNQLRKEWAGEKFSTSEAMLAFKVLLMDTHAAIKGKAALSRRRGKLDPALDPEYAIEAATYSGAERELYLDRLRNEVAVLLEKNNVDWDLFDLYLMHKRNIHDRAEKLNPWGYNAKTSAEAIEKMRQRLGPVKMAAIERAQKSFWKLRQELVISKVEESSVFSDDLRNKIADNEHYAHFSVIDYLDAQYGKGNGIHIYKAVGTVKPIMGPATATVMQDLSLMTSINWNSAKLSVMDFLLSDFADEIAEADKVWANGKYQFIPPKDKDKVLLVGMFKGQFQGYYVNKWVGEAFDRGDYKAIKVAASIARAIGAPFRALFTGMRPGFWLFNMLRDYMRAVKNLPKANLRRFGGHWLRAWIPAAQSVWGHPTPIVQEMLHDQMLISIADVDRLASEDRQINRLLNMYTGAPLKFYNKFTRPFVGLFRNFMRISQTIERVPKIAGYTYLRENFPQMSDEQVAHIVRNQVGSPSFITRGSATWFTNNLFLFSNAMIQGWRSDIEVMTQSKGEAVFKLAKYTILPKAIMWALSSGAVVKLMGLMGGGDDDDTVKWFKAIQQLYLNIPEYDKTNYTCIPYGRTSGGKTKYLRVPTDEGQRFFAGVFYKMMNLPQNGIDTFPQTLDYTAGQLPGLNPAFKIASVVWDYIAGRNPYDTFRNQYVMPETLFNARNTKSHIAMLKWVANESGASIIQRFNLDTMDKPATATEKIISMPVSSDIIGRFIKVSDYGRREALKKVSGDTERKRARELLELRDIAIKLAKGEKLSGKEQSLADKNQQYLKHRTKLAQAKVEGDTYANELLYARSTAERYAMQKRIMEIEGPGFDITPYIESDIVDHSQVLARKIPIKTAERHAHDAQVQEALEWLRERNVPDDTVLKLYRQSVSKMKDKNAAGHNIQRVRVQLNKLGITSKKRSA